MNLQEIELQYNLLWKEIEKLKTTDILVPDNIKIIKSDYSMWILNWNQELFYNFNTWNVYNHDDINNIRPIKCKLVPTTYEDLKPWDVFYRSDSNLEYINKLYHYNIKLEDWSYQSWYNKDCINGNDTWEYYYKVVAL